jgi:hypothetical protein
MAYEHAVFKLTDATVILSNDGDGEEQTEACESEVKLHGFGPG